jgi:hypothetical protein
MCIHWQFQARSCLPEFWSENVNPELKRHTVCIKIWSILETKMCTWSQPQMGQSFQSLCRFSCKPETSYKILNNIVPGMRTHLSDSLLHSTAPLHRPVHRFVVKKIPSLHTIWSWVTGEIYVHT